MKPLYLPVVLMSLFLFSCGNKQDSTENNDLNENLVVVDKPFTVTVNLVAEKDDTFQVYFNEDGLDNYEALDAVTLSFTGSKNSQDLVFNFPEEVSPMALRFDIGANKDLNQVVINSFKIEYKQKVIEIKGVDFSKYFTPNPQVKYDSSKSTANIEIDETVLYDPIFLPTPELKKLIQTLYSEKTE
jgi:hypothetical protein